MSNSMLGYFREIEASNKQLAFDIDALHSKHEAARSSGVDGYQAACRFGWEAAMAETADRQRCIAAARLYGVEYLLNHQETKQ